MSYERAESSIQQIEIAALAVTEFRRRKFNADEAVDVELDAQVNSLLGQPNPETSKPHSVSSATAAAKKSEQFRATDSGAMEAQNALTLAENKLLQVQLRARLAVRLVGVDD